MDKIVKTKLRNGMTQYIRTAVGLGKNVYLALSVRAGSVNEYGCDNGIAHFLEHVQMCFDKKMPGLVDCFAYTDFYSTTYYFNSTVDKIEDVLEIIKCIITGVYITNECIGIIRQDVMDEYYKLDCNRKASDFQYVLKNSEFIQRMPIGRLKNIMEFQKEQVWSFFEQWYCTDNMALVVMMNEDSDDITYVKEKLREIHDITKLNLSKKIVVPLHYRHDSGKVYNIPQMGESRVSMLYVYPQFCMPVIPVEKIVECLLQEFLETDNLKSELECLGVEVKKVLFTPEEAFMRIRIKEPVDCVEAYKKMLVLLRGLKAENIISFWNKTDISGSLIGINCNTARQECINNFVYGECLFSLEEEQKVYLQLKSEDIFPVLKSMLTIFEQLPVTILR